MSVVPSILLIVLAICSSFILVCSYLLFIIYLVIVQQRTQFISEIVEDMEQT